MMNIEDGDRVAFIESNKASLWFDKSGCTVFVRRDGMLPIQPTEPTFREAVDAAIMGMSKKP